MIVVSDTSPLNYLVLIGQDRVLPTLFARVIAPPAVMSEMLHPGAPVAVYAWASSPPVWLEVIVPSAINHMFPLGQGELEAIALAQELRADALLLDGRKAFGIARQLGLAVTGTIGVLELAAKRRLIDPRRGLFALSPTFLSFAIRTASFVASQELVENGVRTAKVCRTKFSDRTW